MRSNPDVGDVIELKAFSYSNKEGGTGMSDWDHDEKFLKPIKVKVTKEWEDYECGQRGWAQLWDEDDHELIAYLSRNARTGHPSHGTGLTWIDGNDYVIFWSEFAIIKIEEI